jgi:hypothetical protein
MFPEDAVVLFVAADHVREFEGFSGRIHERQPSTWEAMAQVLMPTTCV